VRSLGNTDPALRRAWHPILRLADLEGPREVPGTSCGPVRLLGERWVVGLVDGEVVVRTDRCPHPECATAPAAVATHLGLVWIAPEPPVTSLPPDPLAADDRSRFATADLPTVITRAGAGLLIDNFLDMAHFPFVHLATIGAEEEPLVPVPTIERDGLAMTVRSSHRFPNREDPEVLAGRRPLLQTRHVTYRYTAPFSASLRIDYEEAGGSNVITFFVQSVDDETCTVHTSIARDDIDHDPERLAAAVTFEEGVVGEDLDLQRRFVDLTLPLDLTAEVHTKADRATVELRRILGELVTTELVLA
jgi:phenylpropionate dioxygenase-like ring-hydroxylating dioxygenase large terminal subunit